MTPKLATANSDDELARLKAKLFRARQTLVEASPFLGSLVMKLAVTITDDPRVRTAAVTGNGVVWFDKEFLRAMAIPEIRAVLLHETLHLALDVFERRGSRPRLRWNVAHDFAVNALIESCDLHQGFLGWSDAFPPLLDPGFADLTAEEIFDRLPADLSTLGLGPEDVLWDQWENLDPGTRERLRQEWRNRLIQAAELALTGRGIGDLPAGIQKLLGPILDPQVGWQVKLAQKVQGRLRGKRRTYSRPGRRSHAAGVQLPGSRHDRGAVGVFVDVSGSVTPEELGAFMGELNGVLRDGDVSVRLITWDVEVQEDLWLDDPDALREALASRSLQLVGSGGTDPRCLIDYLHGEPADPHPLPGFGLLLTDGALIWPDAEDWPVEILVVSTGQLPPSNLGYESLQLSPLGAHA